MSEHTVLPHSAPWADDLQHRSDPNRIGKLQIPARGRPFSPAGPETKLPPSDAVTARTGRLRVLPSEAPRPQDQTAEPSYYDVPILQKSTWKWQIAAYFYLGGLSAGAYLISRVAERVGGPRYRRLARLGSRIALASILPGPPLLIADLGDPKRFHHMLRVWKPSTPMNLGSWAITLYGAHAAFDVVRQYLKENDAGLSDARRGVLQRLMNNGVLLAIHDAAGVPLALLVSSYTGVLLSCTSNPLWCKNPFLGPLFAASAISTGAEAISVALDARGDGDAAEGQEMLMTVDTAAHAAELACMHGFSRFAGEKAKPLHHGAMKKYHTFSTMGIIAAEVLKRVPVSAPLRTPIRVVACGLGLAAGFAMRWALVYGGREAAADPHLSREVSRTRGPHVAPSSVR